MARTRQGRRRAPKAASKRKAQVVRKVKHARVRKDQKEQAKRAKAKRAAKRKSVTIHPPEVGDQPSPPLEMVPLSEPAVAADAEALGSGQEASDMLDSLTMPEPGENLEFVPDPDDDDDGNFDDNDKL